MGHIFKNLIYISLIILTAACGGGGGGGASPPANTSPTASGVSITDNNGGYVLEADTLSGSYTYSDVDSDVEGETTFRWLRNGTEISGATSITYTLVAADSGQPITFEVTPIAATGSLTGNAVTSSAVYLQKMVQITWNSNPETAVNRSGGGYKLFYSSTSGFSPGDSGATEITVPYVSGATAPTITSISLLPGTYYICVAAYSALNAPGMSGGSTSTASTQTTLIVP